MSKKTASVIEQPMHMGSLDKINLIEEDLFHNVFQPLEFEESVGS